MFRHHHRESIRQSSSPNMISVPPRLGATWSHSVRVTTNRMTAFLWRLQTRKSYRALLSGSSASWRKLSTSSGSNALRLRSHIAAGWTSGFSRAPSGPPPSLIPLLLRSPWRAHKIGWTSNFAATLYGCALGLPGHDAHQWGSRSGCSFTQGPEESDRPGSTCHQSHRPSHRVFDIQPDSVGVSRWRRWKRRTKASRPPRACPKNNGRS